MIPTRLAGRGRIAALGLVLTLGACGGTTIPTTTTATATAVVPTAPRPTVTVAAASATVVSGATAPRAATVATVRATPPVAPPATARVATAHGTPPTLPPGAPRGYALGDPCGPYPLGALPPNGRAVAAAPVLLCIPALALSAPIVAVGATPAGTMAEPANPLTVGWYAPGVAPGALGTAAFVGAVDAPSTGPAIFWHLDLLRPGDSLVVVDEAGVARRFVVLETRVYRREEAPLQRIFGPTGDANVVLITGAGGWDPTRGTYDSNRFVFARLQP